MLEDAGFARGLDDEMLLPDFFEECLGVFFNGCFFQVLFMDCAFCSVGGRVKVFAPVAAFSTGAVCVGVDEDGVCVSAE